jgi:hypothetical protein
VRRRRSCIGIDPTAEHRRVVTGQEGGGHRAKPLTLGNGDREVLAVRFAEGDAVAGCPVGTRLGIDEDERFPAVVVGADVAVVRAL